MPGLAVPRSLQGPGRDGKALAPPHQGCGTAVTTPTCPHCHTRSLVSPGQRAGGTRAGTPHKGAFGAFLGSGGSARSRDDPGGAEPLWLFPLSICAPSPARCCDKPRPPPTSQPAPIPPRRCCHRSLAAPFVQGTKPGSQGTRVYRGIDSCHRGNIQEQPLAPSHGDRDEGEAGLSPPSS